MRQASFEFAEVYYNRQRIQKGLGYLRPPSMNSELTREWRKWHNIIVYETGRPPPWSMPSAPGAPALALTRHGARPRFSGEGNRSHKLTSRPGMAVSSGCAAGRYTQLRCSTELTVSFRQLARVRGMAAITATSTSNTDSSASLDVRPFPAHNTIPAGTTTSADFCPVCPHLAMRAVGAAATTAQPTPGQTPRIDDQFPYARRVYVTTLLMVTGFAFLSRLPRSPRLLRGSCSPVQGFASGFLPPRLTTTQLPPARS